MRDPLVLSMDLSTNGDHKYVLKDGPSRTLMEGTVGPCQDDLNELMEQIQKKKDQDRQLAVVLEATGMAWFPVSVFFKQREIPVYRVKAQQSEEFRRFMNRYAKTDQLDAKVLGKLYYTIPDQLYELWLPLGKINTLRRVIQRREDLVENRTQEKNRLQALVKWALPALRGKVEKFTGKKMHEIIVHAVDYQWVCTHMGEERFIRWAKRQNKELTREEIQEIYDAAKEARKLYEGEDYDPKARRWEAQDIVGHIQDLNERIQETEKRMEEVYKQTLPDKPLESMYGIAWKTSAVLKAFLGDGSRFPNVGSAECWVGFIPEIFQSGETDRTGTSIRKDGPPLVRKYLFLATNTARQWDPQIAKTYHKQMVEKGKTHTQAICNCVNKMLRRVLRILNDGKEYQLRDNDGNPINWKEARKIIGENYKVPEKIRKQRRNRGA